MKKIEFKGTKGKWKASPNTCFYDIHVVDNPNRSLCFNIILHDNLYQEAISLSDENKANAILISKAPELLDALLEIVTAFENNALKDVSFAKQLIKEAVTL